MTLRVLLLTTVILLPACASYVPANRQPAPVEVSQPDRGDTHGQAAGMVGPPPPPARSAPSARQPATAPATASATLLTSVDAAIAAGDLERAAAISERALRISPRDATIWYRLARIRYQQQRYADARGLAARALSHAGDDSSLQRQIDDLLQQLNNI
ncbi:MAG: hypothetical protein CMQ34_13040 [Gammaproteobacteria bacterium]|nr:hypothetical protein [Gammaproteobacteria bacterium]|tara:strand:- start:129 stop:599 length:471 start_codon:yes stop_codon:yes gene_type:complete